MRYKRSRDEMKHIRRMVESGGKCKIITFIYDILYHGGDNVNNIEAIRNLFSDGYCYYFAKILQDAFPGGQICIAYPYGHIVYIYDGVPYDIDGISSAEFEEYIPIDQLGDAINDFRHIYGLSYNISKEEIKSIGEKWKKCNTPVYIKERG